MIIAVAHDRASARRRGRDGWSADAQAHAFGERQRSLDRKRRRSGLVIVEAAVVIMVTLMLILGIFEFSRWLMIENVCSNAARNGARMAAARTDTLTTTQLVNYIESMMPKSARPFLSYNKNTNIKVFNCDKNGVRIGSASDLDTWKNAGFDDYIGVEISGNYKPIVPLSFVGVSTIKIRSFALVYSEAN